jgi:hypothetical protein
VVTIAGKDFNLDMDKYIKKRRTTDSSSKSSRPTMNVKEKINEMRQNMNEWKVFSLFKRKERDYDEDIEEDDDDEEYIEEETEIEAIDEIEDELEERRESALKRFFKTLRMRRRARPEEDDDYEVYEETEENLEDIKEVIKITHKWLEELPPETIERFRRSEDFVKYKEALRKLKMIK